ncbi:hypothetical protein C4580_04490 [Candidatus Woesearchaeota archaeon]|nr:MAG: hypothetical protein C4580_04490 [Candidatus Woesearchaeota archaeon]
MESYKKEFITFLLATGALKVGDDRTLKSGRISPWFVNIGDFNDGESTAKLGLAYAGAVKQSGIDFDTLYGIPEKGVGLAIATSIGLAQEGMNRPWFFTRKIPKGHGEGTGTAQATVGRAPKNGQRICQLDDVFTAGDAKYQARDDLARLGTFELPLLTIAVDRQEVGPDGTSAIEKYERDTGTKVVAIVTASDVYHYLAETKQNRRALERMANYLRVYGTSEARKNMGTLEQRIITRDRSIIPACDLEDIGDFENLVRETADIDGIGGYKLGFELGLTYGLPRLAEVARKHTAKPLIYDHQKAGTDIPDTGKNFARVCKKAGIDTVIFFPQAGPETERAWIFHALDHGLHVIVGGRMTHPAYAVSEGGFITDDGAMEMYRIAARAGVNNFVVPGNKPDVISAVKTTVESEGVDPVFYAPGFVAQGGAISDAAKAAGKRFHGIVGRGLLKDKAYRENAIEYTSQIARNP